MKATHIPLLMTIFLISFVGSARAQKVETFVKLFNEGKIDEIKKTAVGYISPSLLNHEKKIVRPLVKVTHEVAQEEVEGYFDDILKHAQKEGDELEGQNLEEHKRSQQRLLSAWAEVLFIAKKAGVDVVPLRHKLKGSDIDLIVVVFASEGNVVMAKALGKIGAKIDDSTKQLEGRDLWVVQLKQLKLKIEQGGADQPATAPESKPEGREKSKQKSEGRSQ